MQIFTLSVLIFIQVQQCINSFYFIVHNTCVLCKKKTQNLDDFWKINTRLIKKYTSYKIYSKYKIVLTEYYISVFYMKSVLIIFYNNRSD